MHREHVPRLQLEYRIREIEGEKEKEGDKQNKRVRDAGWWGLPVPEAVHCNSRRLCSPLLLLFFPVLRPRFNNPRPP